MADRENRTAGGFGKLGQGREHPSHVSVTMRIDAPEIRRERINHRQTYIEILDQPGHV